MSVRLPIACALTVLLPPLCFILESPGKQTGQQAAHSNVIQQASFSLTLELRGTGGGERERKNRNTREEREREETGKRNRINPYGKKNISTCVLKFICFKNKLDLF